MQRYRTQVPSPVAHAPRSACPVPHQARPDLLCSIWGPRARAGERVGNGKVRGAACVRRHPAPLRRPGRPALRGSAVWDWPPGFSGSVGWERIRAPHIPAPPPCDSGGGGEGLLICSGGEERETRRKGDTPKWRRHAPRGEINRSDSLKGERG